MAYDKEAIIALAIKQINEKKLTTIEEVVAFLPISKATFYLWKLDELDEIKDPLYRMRVAGKKVMKDKWFGSENPTLQLAWFKIHASPEERDALSMNNKIEHSGQLEHNVTHIFQEIEVKPDDSDSE